MQMPLTSVPDPYGEYDSFGHHNNAMLRRFLDTFGFQYEFISATEFYKSGQFDATLRLARERYDAIMAIMLASLREERQQTYSCFLPIHPETGRVHVCADEGCECQAMARSPLTTRRAANGRCRSRAAM